MAELFFYPGDRQQESVPLDHAELTLVLIEEGKGIREIVKFFMDSGCNRWEGCAAYHAAMHMKKIKEGIIKQKEVSDACES